MKKQARGFDMTYKLPVVQKKAEKSKMSIILMYFWIQGRYRDKWLKFHFKTDVTSEGFQPSFVA